MSAATMATKLETLTRETIEQHVPTIWDARLLLHSIFGRLVRVVYDDGQHARVTRSGVLLDVLRSPTTGVALKFKGLMGAATAEERRKRPRNEQRAIYVLPVSQIHELPEYLAFLKDPVESWPIPVRRWTCTCGSADQVGRFCALCGTKSKNSGRHLGLAFRAQQAALRALSYETGGEKSFREHSCGAMVQPGNFCSKCGVRSGED